MALAEATVRVTLEVAKFERELRDTVTKAAQRAGRDMDRELSQSFRRSGRNAVKQFRDAAVTGMTRAGRDTVQGFQAGFSAGLGNFAGRVSKQISTGLRVPISRAGLDAGRGFVDNVNAVLSAQGGSSGRTFLNALNAGIVAGAGRTGVAAGNALSRGAVQGAAAAGRNAGRQFNLSFGIGTAAAGRPLLLALGVLGAEIVTEVGPALSIIAGFPPLLLAAATAAGVAVTAFKGIGTAFKAVGESDLGKIQESMAKLSPAAQGVVREFQAMRPALGALRREVQDAFFGQLAGQFTAVSQVLTGPLRGDIVGVSTQLGALSRAFLDVFTSAAGVSNLNKIFRGTEDFLGQLRPGIRDITKGFTDFAATAAPGLNSIGEAFSKLLTRMGQFLSRSAQSGKALEWVEGGLAGLKSLGQTLGDLGRIFSTIASAARPLAFALSGIFSVVANLAEAFSGLPGPIQTAVLAVALLSRSGLPDFLQRATAAATGQTSILRQMADAFRSTSVVAGDYVTRQGALIANSALLGGATTQTVNSINAASGAFGRIAGVAAGAGSAIAVGFGGALRGLVSVLGGPWGVALAAAGVALAIFSGNQQEAARRVAEYNARVREIQGTLNKTTGAITQASAEMAASDDRVKQAITTFKAYGIASSDVVQGALQQGDAHTRVEAALRRQVTSMLEADRASGDLGLVMRATGLNAEELATGLLGGAKEAARLNTIYNSLISNGDGTSASIAGIILRLQGQSKGLVDARNGWLEYYNQTQKATESQRLIAAALPPATREAQKLADAMGVLSDNTSDASAKAAAFNEVMNVLAGGTINAQTAQANWNAVLQRVAAQTEDTVNKTKGFGDALITTNGQINTASVNGNTLFQTYQSLSQGLGAASAALVDNALKTGNVSGALQQVATNVANARAAFIAQAREMGITEAKANQLADAYGLIPKEVITKLAVPAYENVRAQLVDVDNKLKAVAPGTTVPVQALTDEAIRRLNEVGVKTERLPDGTFVVKAETQSAVSSLSSLVSNWGNRVLNWVVNIIGGKAMGDIVENARGNILGYANGGRFNRMRPMSANRAEIVKPNTWRVIGDRARGDEAYIPITNSSRSKMLLAETARRMGFQLLADGALLGKNGIGGSSLTVSPGAIVVNAPYSDPELVAKATINELARTAVS